MLPTLLALSLVAQSASTIQGAAMGPNNQPVGQAFIYVSGGLADDRSVPVLGQGVTDAQGRYRIEVAKRAQVQGFVPLQRAVIAYRPGMALSWGLLGAAGAEVDPHAYQLALEPAVKRTLSFADSAGRPLVNVRVMPQFVALGSPQAQGVSIPEVLAERLGVTTDAKGQAVLNYLAPKHELHTLWVTTAAGAPHQLYVPTTSFTASLVSFVLDPGGRLAGRVLTDDGRPAAGALLEIRHAARPGASATWPVRFAGGPIRAGVDGSFQTPPGLLVGGRYQVLVKEDEWQQKAAPEVTLAPGANATTPYPDIVLTPMRALAGRVVDRQGRAVADAEVNAGCFAMGETERLARTYLQAVKARSQTQGQFRVTGLAPAGRVVLVVRAEGFCPSGRVVNEGESKSIQVVLTRRNETPAPTMTTLPGPLAEPVRRKLARQVLEPFLKKALAEGDDADKVWALRGLMAIDPTAALETIDKTTFASQNDLYQGIVRLEVARELAGREPDRAAEIAGGISDPFYRAKTFLELAWRLPAGQNDGKTALIERALPAAHAVTNADSQLYVLAWSAARLMDCGEQEQARALAAEVRVGLEKVANPAGSFSTRGALVWLGRVDLPAARVILEKQVAEADWPQILGNIAAQLAAGDPAEAERLLEAVKTLPSRFSISLRTCYRMAPVDLARARKIALEQTDARLRATALICAASALPPAQRPAARKLALEAFAELDRIESEETPLRIPLQRLLPMLEAIDPALVPELYWRIVTLPGRHFVDWFGLARYQPEVASALSPMALIERTLATSGEKPTGRSPLSGEGLVELASFDPNRAVQVALRDPNPPLSGLRLEILTRLPLIQFLGRPDPTRWNCIKGPYEAYNRTLLEDEPISP